MLFAHRRTLRKGRSFALAINFVGFLLFLGLATYLVFFQEKTSGIWFGKAVFVISALTLPVVMWWLIRLFGGTGEWNIQISETELIWQSPNNVGEKSFRVLIANISKIIREPPQHNSETSDWYFIETFSGERYHLNPSASGINLNKLCNTLEKLGVKYELSVKS
ncbi:MAG: hypothetical protein V9G98_11320 [Candidatus Competibacter sp.]